MAVAVNCRLIQVPFAHPVGELVLIAEHVARFDQHVADRVDDRHDMFFARLHPLLGDRDQPLIEIDLVPRETQRFLRPQASEDQQLKR